LDELLIKGKSHIPSLPRDPIGGEGGRKEEEEEEEEEEVTRI